MMDESLVFTIINEVELKLCIDRTLPQKQQYVKLSLDAMCNQLLNKYQSDLTLTYEQFGADLFEAFSKINMYIETMQNLLESYEPCQKLGRLLKNISHCLSQVFFFTKTHLKQKKHFQINQLKGLEEKLKNNASGLCNRCSKFILRSDIEETKTLIIAGQFNDPFNLYDLGEADFSVTRRRQQQAEYRLKYGETLENRKKIEQKFHYLQSQIQKRSYGCVNSMNQIKNMEQQIRKIIYSFSHLCSQNKTDIQNKKNFQQNISNLVRAVFLKLQTIDRSGGRNDQCIQAGQFFQSREWQELKKEYEKQVKKNQFISKQILMKEKEISDQNCKILRITEDYKRCLVQKGTFESKIKGFLEKQFSLESQLNNISNENKHYLKKIEELQKQVEGLHFELHRKNNASSVRSMRSKKIISNGLKSLNFIKNDKLLDPNEGEKHKKLVSVHIMDDQDQEFNISRPNKSLSAMKFQEEQDKTKEKDKISDLDDLGQAIQRFNLSKRSIRRLASIRQPNSKLNFQESLQFRKQDNELNSEISIQFKRTSKNLSKIRQKSSLKRIKSLSRSQNRSNQQVREEKQKDKQIQNQNQKQRTAIKTTNEYKQVRITEPGKQLEKDQHKNNVIITKKQKSNSILKNKEKQLPIEEDKFIKKQKKMNSVHAASEKLSKKALDQMKRQKSLHNSNNLLKNSNMRGQTLNFDQGKKHKVNQSATLGSTLPFLSTSPNQNNKRDDENSYDKGYQMLYKFYQSLLEEQMIQKSKSLQRSIQSLKISISSAATFDSFKQNIERHIKSIVKEHIQFILSQVQNQRNTVKNEANFAKAKKSILKSHMSQTFDKKQQLLNTTKLSKFDAFFSNSLYPQNNKTNEQGLGKRQSKVKYRALISDKNIVPQWWNNNKAKNVNVDSFNSELENMTNLPQNAEFIKQKMSVLYMSAQDAYKIQRQDPIFYNQNDQNSSMEKTLPSISCTMTPEMELRNWKSQSCLTKNELQYLKIALILLAKLHDKNSKIYEIVKKSIFFPYSYLINGLQCTESICLRNCEGRKTVGGSFPLANQMKSRGQNKMNQNVQSRQLNGSLVKLLILHRKCIMNENRRQEKKVGEQGESKRLIKTRCNFASTLKKVKNEQKSSKKQENVCKHLLDFQLQIQHEFKMESQKGNVSTQQGKDTISQNRT